MYVLCHHVYTCPNLPDGTIPYDGDASEMRFQSPSESIGVARRRSDDVENVEDDEDKAQRCLGPEDVNI